MKRSDLKFLVSLAGHDWYCQHSFVENSTERYLNYVRSVSQYERLHIKLEDLNTIAEYMIKLSSENKQKELHSALNTFKSYIDLDCNNDLYFIVGNNFLYIDDEPVDKISAKHFTLKKQLYEEFNTVKLFFCEVAINLTKKSQTFRDPFTVLQNLTSLLNSVSEMDFSKLMNEANSRKTQEK